MKKIISIVLAVLFLPIMSFAAENDAFLRAENYIERTVHSPTVGSIGGEWAVLGLARSGVDIPQEIHTNYIENLKEYLGERNGVLHTVKYTEYSRVSLALSALGYNPTDFCGYDLIKPLTDCEMVCAQGINGAIWALITLDSGSFDASVAELRDIYIDEILANELAGGGWSLSGSEPAEADITAMALCALAKYSSREAVESSINSALARLSYMQTSDGGFKSGGLENAESCAQVLVALCTLGISPEDERFVKNSHTLTENLLYFQNSDGGFAHLPGGETNLMATEQAFYALCAEKRFYDGKNTLYDMTDVPRREISAENKELLPVVRRAEFEDIGGSFAEKEIIALYERGVINGRSATLFDPDTTLRRGEAAVMCAYAIGLSAEDGNAFDDVPADSPMCRAINAAYTAGIASGVADKLFAPDENVTREQCAVFAAKAAAFFGVKNAYTAENASDMLCIFDDYTEASDWAAASLAFCVEKGIISDNCDSLMPKNNATRAELAVMLYNMLFAAGRIGGAE